MIKSISPNPSPSSSVVSRYSSAIISQGLISGFHFVLNLFLVRILTTDGFGIFAFSFVVAFFFSSITNALASTPLSVYLPATKDPLEREDIESTFNTLTLLILTILILSGMVLVQNSDSESTYISFESVYFVITYLTRQYNRSRGYSRFDIKSVLYGDISYVTTGVFGISVLLFLGKEIAVDHIFLILASANCIAILCETIMFENKLSLCSMSELFQKYRLIWPKTRWALIGAITTIIVSQAHTIVLTTLKGPSSFAPLAAGFVIFGPVRVVLTTMQTIVKPEMSLALSVNKRSTVFRNTIYASLVSVSIVLCLTLLIDFTWQWIYTSLYVENYSDYPMKKIVWLCALATLVTSAQIGPSAALQAMREFKILAIPTIIGAFLSVFLVLYFALNFPTEVSLLGIVTAELFVLVFITIAYVNRLRKSVTNQ